MTETHKTVEDRNYYRMLTDEGLVALVDEEAKPTELEIVLAERLRRAVNAPCAGCREED